MGKKLSVKQSNLVKFVAAFYLIQGRSAYVETGKAKQTQAATVLSLINRFYVTTEEGRPTSRNAVFRLLPGPSMQGIIDTVKAMTDEEVTQYLIAHSLTVSNPHTGVRRSFAFDHMFDQHTG